MSMKISFIVLFSIIISELFGQKLDYKLSMSKPQNHYFEVEMHVQDWDDDSLLLEMPVWAPGSYLIRDFPKNISTVMAINGSGKHLDLKKTRKNKWLVFTDENKSIIIKYRVYAFELSVRTSFLDLSHGFVSGSSVFMTIPNLSMKEGTIEIKPFAEFKKISTSLELIKQQSNRYTYAFKNFDELIDSPIEIGNQKVFSFESGGLMHTVALFGEGNYDESLLKTDMSKIVQECTDVFGFNPTKNYTFIIHNVLNGQGGLEHENSCVLSVNRMSYESNYYGFLSLVAHEYFHLWNVKRIRPIELGPFDYSNENYTSLLWVMEGFTSYYDELILRRVGFYSKSIFLNKLNGMINYVEESVGARVQSVSDASFDAWIKAYKPNENSTNTTMTYYTRGAIIAALIDVMIIKNSDRKQCLDHFLQFLYMKYHVELKRGFTESEFKDDLSKFTGKDMSYFFESYIQGTEILPYKQEFEGIGLKVLERITTSISTGILVEDIQDKVIVKRIESNSSAENEGFSVGDEIIAVNNYRVNFKSFSNILNELALNESIEVLISRDGLIKKINLSVYQKKTPNFDLNENNESQQKALFDYWLR